jgi:hypothetical protein
MDGRTTHAGRYRETSMTKHAVAAAGVFACLSATQPAFAQADVDRRFGTVHFPTSCNEVAQRRFDRGMRYQHSFWYTQAKEIGAHTERERLRLISSAGRGCWVA